MCNAEKNAYLSLKETMESYAPISDKTWSLIQTICKLRALKKFEILYRAGEIPESYAFVCSGLIRGFVTDEKGNEYNKKFFPERQFPGAMASLLTSKPSVFIFEALEDSLVIEINFSAYRKLLIERNDLKLYQIHYLEQNWLLAKDAREIEIVQEDATQRYLRFVQEQPSLAKRLTQYHIASHLGITPTQLSRIRKNLQNYQPM